MSSHRVLTRAAVALVASSAVLLPGLAASPRASAAEPDPARPSAAAPFDIATTATAAATGPPAGGTEPTAGGSWVVVPGDTLTAIARRTGTPGGWPALYAVNRAAIGPSPDLLLPGTVLTVPEPDGPGAPRDAATAATGAPEVTAAGGGGRGVDVGLVVAVPSAAATPSGAEAPALVTPTSAPTVPATSAPAPSRPVQSSPEPTAAPTTATPGAGGGTTSGRVPPWVLWPLVAVGGLAVSALLGDPLLALVRRRAAARRPSDARPGSPPPTQPVAAQGPRPTPLRVVQDGERVALPVARPVVQPPVAPSPVATTLARPQLHVEVHPSLLVSWVARDGLVLVLAPRGQDLEELLHLARVVLPEAAFRFAEVQLPAALHAAEQRLAPRMGA